MTDYELLEIFSMAGEKIDSLWEFFVTVHIAIYGGLFIFHKMQKHQIVILILSYASFSVINLRAKMDEYRLFDSLLQELKARTFLYAHHLKDFVDSYTVSDRIDIAIGIHVIAVAFLMYLLKEARGNKNSAIISSRNGD